MKPQQIYGHHSAVQITCSVQRMFWKMKIEYDNVTFFKVYMHFKIISNWTHYMRLVCSQWNLSKYNQNFQRVVVLVMDWPVICSIFTWTGTMHIEAGVQTANSFSTLIWIVLLTSTTPRSTALHSTAGTIQMTNLFSIPRKPMPVRTNFTVSNLFYP